MRACRLIALAGLAVACSREFPLPTAPGGEPPGITAASPSSAFSGDRVTLTGTGFGSDAAAVSVRFGRGAPVRPEEVSAAGTSLVATVPDDATSGEVSVTTAAGTGTLASFPFRGRGWLRNGRVALTRSLLLDLRVSIPLGNGRELMVPSGGGRPLVVKPDGSSVLVPVDHVIGAAWAAEAQAIVLLSVVRGRTPCVEATPCDAAITVHPAAAFAGPFDGEPLPTTKRIAFRTDEPLYRGELAVSDDARWAIVHGSSVFLVDVEGSLVTQRPADGARAAPLEGSRFVVGGSEGLFVQDAATPDVPAAPVEPGGAPVGAVSSLASVNGRVAAGLVSGAFVVLDFTHDPPTLESTTLVQAERSLVSLALAESGTRLAIGVGGTDIVVTYELGDGPPQPLGASDVRLHGAITSGRDGTFHVASLGETVVLSQRSGNLLARLPIRLGLGSPVLRTLPSCGTVLEVVSTTLDEVLRLQPGSLDAPGCAFAAPAAPRMAVLAATPASSGLFVMTRPKAAIYRDGDGPGTTVGPWLPEDALDTEGVDETDEWQLWAAPEGDAVFLSYFTSVAGEIASRLVLLDPDGPFPPPSPPRGIAFPPDVYFEGAVATAGHVAWQTTEGVQVRTREAFGREASGPPLYERAFADDEESAGIDAANGYVFTMTWAAEGQRSVTVYDTRTGRATEPALFSGFSFVRPRVSPSARRLYYVSPATGQLMSHAVDPQTGRIGAAAAPIPLPEGASELVMTPDGERMIVIDPIADQLVLLD